MAKSIILDKTGGPEVFRVETTPMPDPKPGEIIVGNTAIGLNFIDIYQRTGLYPMPLPLVLGSEAAGRIEAIGDGVTGFKQGDRVAYFTTHGAYADYTAIPAALAVKIPDDVKETTAAAIFLKGMTVQMLVRQIYPLQKGDSCLVYAAAGGVGSLLCQWANKLGARVIGVVGSSEKTGLAKFHGATNVINRTEVENIAAEVRKLTNNQGVNVVYDSVGKATFEASLDSLAPRGMMVTYGNASGPPPAIAPSDLARRGSLSLIRPTLFHFATDTTRGPIATELFEALSDGTLKTPNPTSFPLVEVADAHRLLESGTSTGPIILIP